MNADDPPRTVSDMIKACGTLVVYAGCALPFFEALFSGRFLVAIIILWIAHLIAGVFSALSKLTQGPLTLECFTKTSIGVSAQSTCE